MSIFRIHCVDRSNSVGKGFFTQVEKLFKEVLKYYTKSGFKDVSAYWWTDRPVHHLAHEPIVWLLPSSNVSLIQQVYGTSPPPNIAGFTKWEWTNSSQNVTGGMISELYLDHPANGNITSQAKIAFHELMHNKLVVGELLHGVKYGQGLNKKMLDLRNATSASLDSPNIQKMGAVLTKPVPQWVPDFN